MLSLSREISVNVWKNKLEKLSLDHPRVYEAITPMVENWIARENGYAFTFRVMQIATGHGCCNYFLCRINKFESPICFHGGLDEGTANHTLEECNSWDLAREKLFEVFGNDLNLWSIVKKSLGDAE
ncbi:uncharacterized protein LOC105194958 [Solenopsis invicta]|uniref:uncharacterized protein LOC105194958 n=1 Tax=Solenopsis invicta TaxID=13686 RepID=UPI000595FD71|nr:uncharacterized protein LOC105194958 [Solenopsis invicta]